MGGSQSKRRSLGYVSEGRRLEHGSIAAAIASNRRQRKLLLKQMARQAQREASAHLSESMLYEQTRQVCQADCCRQSSDIIYTPFEASFDDANTTTTTAANNNHRSSLSLDTAALNGANSDYRQLFFSSNTNQNNLLGNKTTTTRLQQRPNLHNNLSEQHTNYHHHHHHPIYLPPIAHSQANLAANGSLSSRRPKQQQQQHQRRLRNHLASRRDLTKAPRQRQRSHDVTTTTILSSHHEEKLLAVNGNGNSNGHNNNNNNIKQRQSRANDDDVDEPLAIQTALVDKGLARQLREEKRLRERKRQGFKHTNPTTLIQQQQQQYNIVPTQRRLYNHHDETTTTGRKFELTFPVASDLAALPGSQSTSSQYSSQSHHSSNSSQLNQFLYHDDDDEDDEGTHHYSSPEQQQDPNRGHQQANLRQNTRQQTPGTRAPTAAATMTSAAATQRSLAYTEDERRKLRLDGLLPAAYQDQALQVRQVMNFIDKCEDELSRYVYLRNLKDFNERLFYAALTANVERLMPLVYTPTVGLACQRFSEIYLRPRGLYVTLRDLGRVAHLLSNWPERDVRVIVVTDGERILGLGDLGANGMGISIGKLSLYTALAGIPPANVLPVCIDVGTNNKQNLADPFYIGLRQERTRGPQYYALIEEFMEAVVARWGRSCLIQFEDFANATAFDLLQRYRDAYCTFNDDIQGTASVCLSGLISAAKLINRRLSDCSFLFYGAGEANLGTANLLVMAMQEDEEKMSEAEARKRIYLIDSKGLVVVSRGDLSSHKRQFAQDAPHLRHLEEIIEHVKPVAIIGASAQGGAFTESICRKMATYNERPIIFALSNPTSKAECTAQQAYNWTEGKCVFASGSPFDPVQYNGKTYVTGQGNNAYIFPGVGLAAIAAHVHTIPEDTFLVAARALSDQLLEEDTQVGLIYPSLTKIRQVTLKVATRVLEHLYTERLATYRPEPDDKTAFLESIQYDCRYESEAGSPAAASADSLKLHKMSLAAKAEEK